MEYYCQIFQEIILLDTKNCPFNMKKAKDIWCTIYEENSHDIRNCELNKKNKLNYHILY